VKRASESGRVNLPKMLVTKQLKLEDLDMKASLGNLTKTVAIKEKTTKKHKLRLIESIDPKTLL
jgi:hypothetical protein